MKSLPPKFLESLEGIEGFNKEAFLEVHDSGEQITSIRINPAKTPHVNNITSTDEKAYDPYIDITHDKGDPSIAVSRLPFASPVPWTEYGFYLKQRPSFTFDPLFHAGCY
ncbi:MAG: hypothetical protein ACXVBF_01620 [Flavisolibacter sp.]